VKILIATRYLLMMLMLDQWRLLGFIVEEANLNKHSNNKYTIIIIFVEDMNLLSRAINFGRQCHFKIWLDYHKFKKNPCLIMPMSKK
jgi:hypothetical protein